MNFRFCKNNLNLCKNRAQNNFLLNLPKFHVSIIFSQKCLFVFISCWHVFIFKSKFTSFLSIFASKFCKNAKMIFTRKFFVSNQPVTSSHNTILSGLLVYPSSLSLASPLLQNKSGAQLLYLSVASAAIRCSLQVVFCQYYSVSDNAVVHIVIFYIQPKTRKEIVSDSRGFLWHVEQNFTKGHFRLVTV